MKKGWKKGFNLGRKASKYIIPPATALALGWYAYEATDNYIPSLTVN